VIGFAAVFEDVRRIWDERPVVIVLLLLGLAVFVFVVVDAWRRRRHRHPGGRPR
jgi:hypothetical protein